MSGRLRQATGILSSDILKIRHGLYYSRNHTWTHLGMSGNAKVGLDDLLLNMTGAVSIVHLRIPGEIIRKGDAIAEIVQKEKVLRILSPISGSIAETNPAFDENPGLLNEDPYGEGWLLKIKPSDWTNETGSCFLAERAVEWSVSEIERFKEFMAASMVKNSPEPAMATLQDGGELRNNALAVMPVDIWQDFQEEFMGRESRNFCP
jgi:glycine cleavage system H protein